MSGVWVEHRYQTVMKVLAAGGSKVDVATWHGVTPQAIVFVGMESI